VVCRNSCIGYTTRGASRGIVLEDLSTDTIVKTITDLANFPKKYQTLVNNVSKIKIKKIKEMTNDYKNLYKSLIKERKMWSESNDHTIYQLYKVNAVIQSKEELVSSGTLLTQLLTQSSNNEGYQMKHGKFLMHYILKKTD